MSTSWKLTAGSLALALCSLTSPAEEQVQAQRYGNWSYYCQQQQCAVSQLLKDPLKAGNAYSAQFARVDGKLVLQFDLPLGIYLPANVAMKAGDQAITVPVLVCLPQGCKALTEVTPALRTALAQAPQLDVAFYTSSDKPIKINFPLQQLSEALTRLEQ